MTATPTLESKAESLIRATGARLTRPRMRVLSFLLEQGRPLTHNEVLEALPGEKLDAVTLYRVLEWLTGHRIVHRIEGADHVWRFSADPDRHGHEHAHFQCTRCETVTCVNDMPLPPKVTLPAGFTSEEVNLLIKGTCARCKG
ncbi:transcriptional repressor [Massilia forsythiae]|uniref:Transcriptional repressor n=1 Tax=Massilia forsythiae TaxID=2728020 RepID=A0A7Z2VTK9_9BURK|nr:Fur family transcriptional regulator [Massilia forsythiae]QJD98978.1 transcriptional repressor [Massilia forsythiae]